MDKRLLARIFLDRPNLREAADGPYPLPALNRNAGTPRVLRDHKAGAEVHGHAPLPPRRENSDDSSVPVLRDDRMVVEDRGREQRVQADAGLNESPAKPRNRRRKSDESLSVGTIAATMAGVIVVGFALTALLPSILTRDGVDSTATAVAPPASVEPFQTEQFGAIQPVPGPDPAQQPAPVQPAPVSNDSTSVAKTAPVLKTGSVPSEKQAGGRVTGAEVLVPNAGKGAATGRTDLTAAEKAAVARGLKELKNTAAINAPRRSATTRSALTEEEKAAVERGLRELEKAAGQAKQ